MTIDPPDGGRIAPYSSQGPTNDGNLAPDVAAPSGFFNSVYSGSFSGTSASAPVIAGAAALLLDAGLAANANSLGDLIRNLAASNPDNAAWQRDLSVSLNKIGSAQFAKGDREEALQSYRDSLAIRERLARSDPGNAGRQRDLAWSYWRLAQNGDAPTENWQKVVDILTTLNEKGRLAPSDRERLPIAVKNLSAALE